MCNIRRICRNLMPRTAEAADTVPSLPTTRTMMEAVTTTRSGEVIVIIVKTDRQRYGPITQIGFLINLTLPQTPWYLEQ